ncbi:hypothetical protein SEA_LOZINAK_10 [Gordonia phage Lozinak]|uniref:Lipoprotein n=3 Tax=Smoothievirus smoothie TaxID=1982561 RepID=A0A2D1GFU2_9CAUD|nr:secreted protein [Gordonia phage Smoothie]YP_009281171.1 secreted protein [Gordonia phage Cucurbita]ATN90643.1 hypothetical protein SEA_LOZINAK_10 [Gordonia phage Lozinak]AUE23578.1 hypothetical protein SEA_TONIANN_10 [Gordonia phage Toniann]QAU06882.1 hypothetical protein SEA_APHELION_10 [Gordonia phage Aphelion]QKY79595.1 hypothetical protein SEA_ENGINEER_10 [Gordonia Phage Engineer]QYC53502.1 hypothetical protein SEA_NORVS_10 [Gordonia phage Norvs]
MKKITTATVAALLAVGALAGCSTMNQEWHRNCVVEDKDTLYSSTKGDSSREYRLSTSCGSFTVGDSISGGFSSWDTWRTLKEGRTYDIQTGGYRIGVFSQFPTVIAVEEKAK